VVEGVTKPEVCEGCVSGSVHTGTPIGSETVIAGLNTYVVGEQNKSRTILFITDVFGYKLNNCRLLADDYSKAGFYVVVPDVFEGDYVDVNLLDKIAPYPEVQEQKGVIEKGKDKVEAMASLGPFMLKHREGVSKPKIDRVVDLLRSDSQIKKIGVIGFCWGGRHAVLLTDPTDGKRTVDAAVAAHPAGLSIPSDIKPIAKPILFEVGSIDEMFSAEDAKKTEEALVENNNNTVPYKIEIFPNMVHGFAIRGDLSKKEQLEAREKALQLGVEWFNKYLS